VIYQTAVICRHIGWFSVFCARRMDESGYAEAGLVDTANSHNRPKLCALKLNVIFVYFYKQIFSLKQFRKVSGLV